MIHFFNIFIFIGPRDPLLSFLDIQQKKTNDGYRNCLSCWLPLQALAAWQGCHGKASAASIDTGLEIVSFQANPSGFLLAGASNFK